MKIRPAKPADIAAIEAMYAHRVAYNDAHNIHQWNIEEVTWECFSKLYTIDDYVVGEVEQTIACGMFLVDVDALYWPERPQGASLYLHKICVDPTYRGNGYSDALIQHFIAEGKRRGYADVRLDVRAHKKKLREMYERNGFTLSAIKQIHPDFLTALYVYRF